jgi:uncharacterized protein (UPF0218 family)
MAYVFGDVDGVKTPLRVRLPENLATLSWILVVPVQVVLFGHGGVGLVPCTVQLQSEFPVATYR